MAEVRLEHVTKRFGAVTAVRGLSLHVQDGELVALLGPSGCGKTTTLRCIGGFIDPDEGEIFFGGRRVTHLEPEQRNIGMVFQSYALFPHMTVFDNVAFGLRMRRAAPEEVRRRAQAILDKVQLTGMERRYPRQLSGGQQQRVALARALVCEPEVLLLDEPLANLDAKLREEMRFYIRSLQKEVGITTIYVTHDQAEAMVFADRIAVMFDGVMQQLGTPEEVYQTPATQQVADFIGLTNFLPGRVVEVTDGVGVVETTAGRIRCREREGS
ncbi:MAG: ABC transporter ATP-binding protein, partial [Armatimonadetes bacterium]|nr:ABC transporter ATP-binding protein [Armatimonadota bacterium]